MVRKKLIALCAAVCMLLGTGSAMAQDQEIQVTVDGAQVVFDQPPVIVDDRTLVPLRAIFEALGAQVEWNGDTQTVFARRRFDTVSLQIGQNELYKNGETVTMDVPAQLISDRTMVPLRAVSEAFGLLVQWNGADQSVAITSMPEAVRITDHAISGAVADVDHGVTLIQATCAYPQISNPDNDSVLATLNQTLEDNAQAYVAEAKEQGAILAQKAYEECEANGTEFSTFIYDREFDITYNQGNKLAVVERMTETIVPGVRPTTTLTAGTYDLTTGELLEPTAFCTGTTKEVYDAAAAKFLELLQLEPEAYLPSAAEQLNDGDRTFLWFPTKVGMAFCLQENTIAPQAAGIQYIVIQYFDNADFFKDDYTYYAEDDQYIFELMRVVGANHGWDQDALNFEFQGNSDVEVASVVLRAIAVTDRENGNEVARFAVSPDLLYIFEFDTQSGTYRSVK